MAFNSDFWVATAAAAPVIALAAIVALTDTGSVGFTTRPPSTLPELGQPDFAGVPDRFEAILIWRSTIIATSLCFISAFTQVVILVIALDSLTSRGSQIPPVLVTVIEAVAIVFMLLAAAFTIYARMMIAAGPYRRSGLQPEASKETPGIHAGDRETVLGSEQIDD